MIGRLWFVLYRWLFGSRPVTMRNLRSPLWRPTRREHLRREPVCQYCGAGVKGRGIIARVLGFVLRIALQVHHILPFHLRPELELDPNNLITLCRKCHLEHGHLGDYRKFNSNIREECAAHQAAKARKTRDVGLGDLGAVFIMVFVMEVIRQCWLAALALLLVIIPAGALLVCGWLWLFEQVPTITLVCTGIIPAIVGGIYFVLRKLSAHVI